VPLPIKEYINPLSILFILLILASIVVISPVFSMLFLAAIIAYCARPVYKKIGKHCKYDSISVFISLTIFIIPLIILVIITLDSIIDSTPVILDWVHNFDPNDISRTINSFNLPFLPDINISTGYIMSSVKNALNDILGYTVNFAADSIAHLANIFLELFILIAATYYFIRDGDKLVKYFSEVVPPEYSETYYLILDEFKMVMLSIFYGHFLTSVIIGIMAGIGYFILGYPYVIVLAFLTGFLQLLPIVGPWVVYLVLLGIDIASGNYFRAVLILGFGIILSSSDVVIRPKLAGKYSDIHPLLFLIGFLTGPLVFGAVGFILGPLILGMTYSVLNVFKMKHSS
jgi:predicted PurR-regulated permease PerM